MKKKVLLTGILASIVLLAAIVFAAIPEGTNIKVTLISQEPDPANPGDVVNLRFKIENLGTKPTEDLIFEVLPEYPFSLYRGSIQRTIGSLQGYQTGDDIIILLYEIKVDEDAAEGIGKINVRFRADKPGSLWTTIKDLEVRIRTRDIVISIESITSSPDPIPPGQEASITFKIKNNADSLVRDLKVKLDVSDETVPFAPVKSTAERSIYQIDAKSEINFGFYFVAEPDAEGGIYKIPLTVSYADETGASYSKEDVISLKIASSPDLLATVDSTNIYSKNKAGDVTIKIVNRGLTNIKLLTAKLKSNDDFEVLSQQEVYIGNIDSDDYETVDFKLDVKSREEVVNLPLVLIYMDSTNKEFIQTADISLRMFSASEAQKAGLVEKQSVGFTIMLLIVVVGLGIYFWRRRKKKKAAQKK